MDLAIFFAPQKNMVHFNSEVLNTLSKLMKVLAVVVMLVIVLADGRCSRNGRVKRWILSKARNDTYPIGR